MALKFPIADDGAVRELFIRFLGGDDAVFEECLREALAADNPCGLTDTQRMAIWVYSSTDQEWYERINRELWGGVPSDDVQFLAELLYEALYPLPLHTGEVYRGFRPQEGLDAFAARYTAAYDAAIEIPFPGFTSTSRALDKAFRGNVFSSFNRNLAVFWGPMPTNRPRRKCCLWLAAVSWSRGWNGTTTYSFSSLRKSRRDPGQRALGGVAAVR